jgi:predicted PurR-regulated permease PerM
LAGPPPLYPARVRELLEHPWVKLLLIATAIAMCTFALRETAWITEPIVRALGEVLVPVVVGFAIAYVLTPIVDAISRQSGVRRFAAAGLLFGVVSLGVAVVLVMVVPAVVHEGVTLTERVFQGQTYSDLQGKVVTDKSLLSSCLDRLEDWQMRLRIRAHLAFDRRELSYLDLLESRTAALRAYQAAMLEMARSGSPLERWPAAPPGVDDGAAATVHELSWPSPSTSVVDQAALLVPEDARERWLALMRSSDLALSALVAKMSAGLDGARSGSQEPLAVEVRDAWQLQLTPARTAPVQAFADQLEAADQAGEATAHHLATQLHGESVLGARTMAELVEEADKGVRGALEALPARLGAWTGSGLASVGNVFNLVLDAVLVPIYAFFLVLAMPDIRRTVHRYVPVRHADQIVRIIRDIEKVVAAFFRGRLIICSCCALAAWLGFSLIGWFSAVSMPYSALFGIAIGFATTVPLSGLLFLLPALGVTMLQPGAHAVHALLIVGVYCLVQALESVLIPLIMGREVELHPVVLLIALLLCGKLLGILGLILAVPIAASCRILAREFLWPRLLAWAQRLPTRRPIDLEVPAAAPPPSGPPRPDQPA